jgi:hypothetical protein
MWFLNTEELANLKAYFSSFFLLLLYSLQENHIKNSKGEVRDIRNNVDSIVGIHSPQKILSQNIIIKIIRSTQIDTKSALIQIVALFECSSFLSLKDSENEASEAISRYFFISL